MVTIVSGAPKESSMKNSSVWNPLPQRHPIVDRYPHAPLPIIFVRAATCHADPTVARPARTSTVSIRGMSGGTARSQYKKKESRPELALVQRLRPTNTSATSTRSIFYCPKLDFYRPYIVHRSEKIRIIRKVPPEKKLIPGEYFTAQRGELHYRVLINRKHLDGLFSVKSKEMIRLPFLFVWFCENSDSLICSFQGESLPWSRITGRPDNTTVITLTPLAFKDWIAARSSGV